MTRLPIHQAWPVTRRLIDMRQCNLPDDRSSWSNDCTPWLGRSPALGKICGWLRVKNQPRKSCWIALRGPIVLKCIGTSLSDIRAETTAGT